MPGYRNQRKGERENYSEKHERNIDTVTYMTTLKFNGTFNTTNNVVNRLR